MTTTFATTQQIQKTTASTDNTEQSEEKSKKTTTFATTQHIQKTASSTESFNKALPYFNSGIKSKFSFNSITILFCFTSILVNILLNVSVN